MRAVLIEPPRRQEVDVTLRFPSVNFENNRILDVRRMDRSVAVLMTIRVWVLLVLLVLGTDLRGAVSAADPAVLVTEPRVHDPCMIRAGGFYYVFGTGRGVSAKRSRDLVHWQRLSAVFEKIPGWAAGDFRSDATFWAPDISFFGGQYHLYYCISNYGKNRSAIGFATNQTLDPDSPGYRWVDHGKVVESFPTDSFNAIDPGIVLDDEGVPWLSFGSFWDGIHVRRLTAGTGVGDAGDKALYSVAARPKSVGRAVEGAYIVHRESFYYLFVSFDLCCHGVNSTYHIMVGRSRGVTGPYVDRAGMDMRKGGGSLVLASDPAGRVRGPGGCTVVQDGDRWLLVHHFYDAEDHGAAKLQIRPLTWTSDEWPVAGEPILEGGKR